MGRRVGVLPEVVGVLEAVPRVTTFQKVDERVEVDGAAAAADGGGGGGGALRMYLEEEEEEALHLTAAAEAATSPN